MSFDETSGRAGWMSLMACAAPADLAALMPRAIPGHDWLRAPETGTAMVRGRTGATGTPFNLGEMTVTRCALRLADGSEGHAHVQGRDRGHATRAALIDALMQGPRAAEIRAAVLDPLAEKAMAERRARAGKAAATKVNFFTMVRGEG
jgi:alpha-D-ribose 1-methylphosphonate 5-triphosphate synthase subunit PhnG